jgi:hypothetical protein
MGMLKGGKILDCTQIIAKMQVACWLHPGKYTVGRLRH